MTEVLDTSILDSLSPNRPGLVRSKSSQSHSRHSRSCVSGAGFDSIFFHEDGTTYSEYAYSEFGNGSDTWEPPPFGEAGQVDDSMTLYTTDQTLANFTDNDAVERAIVQGQLRALGEKIDPVMKRVDHTKWSLPKTIPVEGVTVEEFCSQGHRASSVSQSSEDRKQARKHSRQLHANKKNGQKSSDDSSPNKTSLAGSTEECSMSTAPSTLSPSSTEGFSILGLAAPEPPLEQSVQPAKDNAMKKATSSKTSSSRRSSMKSASKGNRRSMLSKSKTVSQPNLMKKSTYSACNRSMRSVTSNTTKTCEEGRIKPAARPNRESRPPVTSKTRGLVLTDKRGRRSRRSRSLTRAAGAITRSVSRSLSRTVRRMKGSRAEDNSVATEKTKKKNCTCPSEKVMLSSCPRHGSQAKKMLKKRKDDEEKSVRKSRKDGEKRQSHRGDETKQRPHKPRSSKTMVNAGGKELEKPRKRRERGKERGHDQSRLASSNTAATTAEPSNGLSSLDSKSSGPVSSASTTATAAVSADSSTPNSRAPVDKPRRTRTIGISIDC